ncbi:MAG TPA: outer membrane lipoprotein carrier protein LolA [bacterium]|nr:outer membrane lipoprotein carrier protein LolA [bacterium]
MNGNSMIMRFFIYFLILPFLFSLGFAQTSYAAPPSNPIIKKIESRYKNVHSMSAYFYQKEIIPGYSQNMVFKGYFYYKHGDGMTWFYEYPFHKKQIFKNNKLYIVNNQIKKVSVINMGKKKGGFPPNVVEVLGNLTKYFKVEAVSANSGSGTVTIELKPLVIQRAKRIYIDFNGKNFKVKSLKIITYQGQIIMFRYKDVKLNEYIKDSVFSIHFPLDYEIMKENR